MKYIEFLRRVKMKCPYCETEPLELIGTINRTIDGTFDLQGNLKDVTSVEDETKILQCASCKEDISLEMLENEKK